MKGREFFSFLVFVVGCQPSQAAARWHQGASFLGVRAYSIFRKALFPRDSSCLLLVKKLSPLGSHDTQRPLYESSPTAQASNHLNESCVELFWYSCFRCSPPVPNLNYQAEVAAWGDQNLSQALQKLSLKVSVSFRLNLKQAAAHISLLNPQIS